MKTILKGGIVLTAGNIAVRFGSYLYRILMGRMLTPFEYGLLNLALPLQFLVIVLTSSGIAPTIAKFVSEDEGKKDNVGLKLTISSSLFYYSLIGLILGAIFFLLAQPLAIYLFREPRVVLPLQISAIAMPFAIAVAVCTGVFQGFKRFALMGGTLVLEQAFRIIFAVVFVYFGLEAVGAISGSSLGFVVTVPLALLLLKKHISKLPRPELQHFKHILYFSIPTSITALSAFLLAYIDIIFLGVYLSPEEVGIYSAASPTSRLLLAFSMALYAVLLPSISEEKGKGSLDGMKRHAKDAMVLSLPLFMLSILIAFSFPEQIITLLFGSAYIAAAAPFKVLVVGMVFLSVYMLNSGILQGMGMPEKPMKILLVAAGLDIFLNALLIPAYATRGAARATAASCIFAGAVSSFVSVRALY